MFPKSKTSLKPPHFESLQDILTNETTVLRGTGKGKGKVVPVLFLTEHHALKVYWGVEL
jgi:hypothetical protein